MSRIFEPTPEQEAGYREWVASRSDNVRVVAERFEPWSLYSLKPHNQRVTIMSFSEKDDGTVTLTVNVSGEYNFTLFERNVFGINPDDLEPCDIPDETELVGAMMSSEQVDANIDELRLLVRPDLFERNEAGDVVRKDGKVIE